MEWELKIDSWLSSILDREALHLLPTPDPISLPLLTKLVEKRSCFIDCKLPTTRTSDATQLEACGFRLADTNVQLEKPVETGNKRNQFANVRFAKPTDRADVRRIAESAFTYSRFHLDPFIPKNIANTIKGEWAENYFAGKRGDAMVVAEFDGRAVAFNQLIRRNDTLIIDLIGVAAEYRGKGIAESIIRYAEEQLTGISKYRVGTQIGNVPSLRLYERLGFRIVNSDYVFHFHGKATR